MTRAGTLLAGFLVVFGVLRAGDRAARDTGIDFYQFWAMGRFAHRAPDPYADATRAEVARSFREVAPRGSRLAVVAEYRSVLDTYSTPFLYALFGNVATGDYDTDYLAFQWASNAAGAAGIAALGVTAGLALPDALLLSAVVILAFFPFDTDVSVGNVGRMQVALLAGIAGLLGRRRDGAAGALLGVGLAFKPTLALCVPLLLVSRRGRGAAALLGGIAGGGLLAVAVGAWAFGSPLVWLRWIHAVGTMPAAAIDPRLGNLGLVPLVAPLLGSRGPSLAITLGAGAAAAWLLWRARPATDLPALALGSLVTLLGAPLVWVHYYLLAVPALALAFTGAGPSRVFGVAALVLFALPPVALFRSPPVGCLLLTLAAGALFAAVAPILPQTLPREGDPP